MSFVDCNRVTHFCELRPASTSVPAPGAGLPGAGLLAGEPPPSEARRPALLLIHALGTSHRIWDGLLQHLEYRGAVLRYDVRGHGLSELGQHPYSVQHLAEDAHALSMAHGFQSVLVVGLSLGGLVAQALALNAPDVVRGAILCGTAARIGSREGWEARSAQVEQGGLAAISDAVLARWFAPAFHEQSPEVVRGHRCMLERTASDGYRAALEALAEADLNDQVQAIRAPVLVISGELDEVTTPAAGQRLAKAIPGARFELLRGGSHLFPVEKPREVAASIDNFARELGLG